MSHDTVVHKFKVPSWQHKINYLYLNTYNLYNIVIILYCMYVYMIIYVHTTLNIVSWGS